MARFEVLPGLPPYGPLALPFPADGRGSFREGVVVRFYPDSSSPWEGNFQRGGYKYDAVLEHPDGQQVVVIAGGEGYVIDPELRKETHQLLGGIYNAVLLPDLKLLLVENVVEFAGLCSGGVAWRSGRISWDGFRNIDIKGQTLTGEAYSPLSDRWTPFTLDLISGKCAGAIYPAEIATAIPLRRPT